MCEDRHGHPPRGPIPFIGIGAGAKNGGAAHFCVGISSEAVQFDARFDPDESGWKEVD